MFLALTIFIAAYCFIVSDKIEKSLIAMFGGSLMLILKVLPQDKAFEHIDFNVIFLLISMMILIKIFEKTGIFQYLAIKFAKKVEADPTKIILILFFMTAIFSAFLDNITTVLLIAPVSILIANELQISSIPFLIIQIFASNIGGTATLIGDPPNIMIGSAADLTFMDFILNLAPLIVIQLILFSIIFYFFLKDKIKVTNENRARIMDFNEKKLLKNPRLLKKSIIVLALVIFGFMIHGFVGIEAASIALMGAMLLTVISEIKFENVLKEVEWISIFFFIGLFIMVGGLVETGFINLVSKNVLELTKGNIKLTSQIVLWFSGIFSGIVDNIPFVATMIPLIENIGSKLSQASILPIWWALALGACLGGNGTLIGASANIIIANFAKKSGEKIRFTEFLKYSIPITIVSLLISSVYIILRYF
ncbi:MAG: ArsB/NhaD family transporter [Candidatus Mcinerneyibacterium aminivorans]|uniref:ArsB/NhaD family transporter n=1 Tax=Candidatus Mcinerneyibacterium aminivorans TaxID=2703815 RepID=A0A5D0MIE6_9BACT|nr:MAG: ArsB/NhaD family transporter [Candidatus Mcinerneyibacterium aminivorans]